MKKIKWLVLMLMIVVLSFALVACGEEPTEKPGGTVVIIAGCHANARRYTAGMLKEHVVPVLNDSMAIRYEDGEYVVEADVTVIVSDGTPTKVPITYEGEEVQLLQTSEHAKHVKRAQQRIVTDVEDFLLDESLRANDEQVDLVAAISEATNILRRSKKENKYLIILDTGISTVGYMNMNTVYRYEEEPGKVHPRSMAELIHMGKIDDVLSYIDDSAFPDLSGVQLTFVGLGNVGGSQSDARKSENYKSNLENIWKAYFAQCGVDVAYTDEIYFAESEGEEMIYIEEENSSSTDGDNESEGENMTSEEEENAFYPKVDNVPFGIINYDPPEETTAPVDPTEPTESTDPQEIIKIYTSELEFLPNSAVFKDPEKAKRVLATHGDTLQALASGKTKVYVAAAIAQLTPDEQYQKTVTGTERAEAVKALLMEQYGFEDQKIDAIDAGILELSWRTGDEFKDGAKYPIESECQKNRIVCIFSENNTDCVAELEKFGLIE